MLNACDLDFASRISEAAVAMQRIAHVHLKVDTGMSRLGLPVSEASADEASAIYDLPQLKVCGIFSHFATADEPDLTFAHQQYAAFCRFCEMLRERNRVVPPRHMCASAAHTEVPEARELEMSRPGIIIYGVYPDEALCGRLPLQNALQIKAKILQTHQLEVGQPASYGSIWRAEKPSRLATLGLGYADGYPRLLSNRAEVLVCGKRAPIRGRICMDHLMIDITEIPEAQVGSEVTLLGRDGDAEIDVYELSRLSSSIPHELMSRLSPRLARVYKNRI
jgi:alanine racemase